MSVADTPHHLARTPHGSGRQFVSAIPARAEYITLGRLALTGLLAPAGALRRDARRPQARADGGLLELRAPCLPRRPQAGVVEIDYDLQPDRLAIEVSDDGPGFDYVEADGEDAAS